MSSQWYPKQKPRAVEGGVRARTARGKMARTWWSERFVAVLEDIGLGNRLQRGRAYARKGQVIEFDVAAGSVSAQVQGSRARPYRVRIGVTAYGKREWAIVEQAIADNAWYAAKLLAGEMPDDIEEVFAGLGTALFPDSAGELSMDCSCPDWEVPCKHVAAVFYLLAEAFDDDPFLILAWRGREREDLLANLRAARSAGGIAADSDEHGPPIDELLDSFFALQGDLPATSPVVSESTAMLGQLPTLDTEIRGHALVDLLRPAYVAFGERNRGVG